MTKKEKRLRKMRQNPNKVKYIDLINVLLEYGFTIRESKGSHASVRCEIDGQVWRETIVKPHGGKKTVNRTYVNKVLKAIDEIIVVLDNLEDSEEDDDN